jgi:hypothetical protein
MAELAVELTAPIAGLMEAGAGGSTTTGAGRFADRGGVLCVGFAAALDELHLTIVVRCIRGKSRYQFADVLLCYQASCSDRG